MRYRADHGALSPDRGAGGYRGIARRQEVHPGERGDVEDRYLDVRDHDFSRDLYRGGVVVFPGTDAGAYR